MANALEHNFCGQCNELLEKENRAEERGICAECYLDARVTAFEGDLEAFVGKLRNAIRNARSMLGAS